MVYGLQVEHVGGSGRHLGDELLTSSAPDTNANPFPPFPDCDVLQPENLFTLSQLARMLKRKRSKKKKACGKVENAPSTSHRSKTQFGRFPLSHRLYYDD
jgi:hypothetical protein